MLKINKWFGTVFLIGNGARQTPVTLWPTTYSLGHDMEVPCPNWCGCPSAKFLISTPKLTPNHHHDTLLLDTEQISAIPVKPNYQRSNIVFKFFSRLFTWTSTLPRILPPQNTRSYNLKSLPLPVDICVNVRDGTEDKVLDVFLSRRGEDDAPGSYRQRTWWIYGEPLMSLHFRPNREAMIPRCTLFPKLRSSKHKSTISTNT